MSDVPWEGKPKEIGGASISCEESGHCETRKRISKAKKEMFKNKELESVINE